MIAADGSVFIEVNADAYRCVISFIAIAHYVISLHRIVWPSHALAC